MSFKRKFDADEYDDRFEEESFSEVDDYDEEDEDDGGDDEDEDEDIENLDHVRNLKDGLMEERPPPSKRPKTESSVQQNADKQTDVDRRVLKLLQEPAVWVNDKPLPLSSTSSGHRLPPQQQQQHQQQQQILQQQQQKSSCDQMTKVKPTSVSTAPKYDGDNVVCHGSIVDPPQKSRTDPNSSLDRSLGMLDTSLQSSFSLPFKKSRRFFRTSGGYDPMRPSWLENLPDEVIVRIFGFLTKSSLAICARTCKKFQRISVDESLWKRVDLGGKCLPPGVVGQLLSRGTMMLRLAKASVAAPIFENQFGFKFPNFEPCKLQYLDLSMATIETECLELLIGSCVSLKKLSLENCQVNDNFCNLLADQNHETLDTLHLAMVTGISKSGAFSIVRKCRKLTELNLGWTNLSESTLNAISSEFCRSLKKLNLSGHRESLNDDHVEAIVDRCPHLVELDVSDCTNLQSPSLESICNSLRFLESLSTSRCYGITPASYLILKSSTLKYLNIFGSFKELAMNELKRHLPNIEINRFLFSSIARPTVGIKRTSIWNMRVRDVPAN